MTATTLTWTPVCRLGDLERERGIAVLVAGRQIALFRTWDGALYALDHLDPFSNAHVMARGIVGTRAELPVVMSPMYKQAFDLRTGICLDDATVALAVHAVRVTDDAVEIAVAQPLAGSP